MKKRKSDEWTPGPIGPKPRTVAVSFRLPSDLYSALGEYARRVGAPRSYLVTECLRRLLLANGIRRPQRQSAR